MYSSDLRLSAIHALSNIGGGIRRVAKVFGVAPSTLCRWSQLHRQNGAEALKHNKRCPRGNAALIRSKIVVDFLRAVVLDDPFTSQTRLREKVKRTFQFEPSRRLVGAVLRDMRLARVKCRLKMHSVKQGAPAQADYRSFSELWRSGKAVSVDETGFCNQYAPRTGYATKGERLYIPSGARTRKWFTAIVAVSTTSPAFFSLLDGSATSASFSAFIDAMTYPPGTVLVMDNASIHKTKAVSEALTRRGYIARRSPAYSPEFNPIENVFGAVKADFRRRLAANDAAWRRAKALATECLKARGAPSEVSKHFRHTAELLLNHG